MKEEIRIFLHDPRELEKLYRTNKTLFKREFTAIYPDFKGNTIAEFWNERLNFHGDDVNWGTGRDLMLILAGTLLAGIIAKLPAILSINEDFYYPRNIGFIIFPILTAYFAWKNKLSLPKSGFIAAASLCGIIYINSLPDVKTSDTLILSCIHLLFFLWAILGFAFVGDKSNSEEKRLSFLKYNGDLLVMTTLIIISGAILSAITIGLFSLIGFNIEKFYFENVIKFGLPAAPILGTYLTQTNPQLVGKVSPVIAKIFSPVVLVMLVVYFIAIIYSGKDPYKDRDFLLLFNALLVGVMAIIFFSVAESSTKKTQLEKWVLLLLSILTIIVNGVALSAILFRISEWGLTPNRAAVLGGNLLMLINLLLVTVKLFRLIKQKEDISGVGHAIASYLPVYFLWASFVTFIFPILFGFK